MYSVGDNVPGTPNSFFVLLLCLSMEDEESPTGRHGVEVIN